MPRTLATIRLVAPCLAVFVALSGCAAGIDAGVRAPVTASGAPSATAVAVTSPPPSAETGPVGPPDAHSLIYGPGFVGSLEIGQQVPDKEAIGELIAWSPDRCTERFAMAGLTGEDPGRWVPNYSEQYPTPEGDLEWPFSVDAYNGSVERLWIRTDVASTIEGVSVGSTVEDVVSAYPNATVTQHPDLRATTYMVEDSRGRITFVVPTSPDMWGEYPVGQVMWAFIDATGTDLNPLPLGGTFDGCNTM